MFNLPDTIYRRIFAREAQKEVKILRKADFFCAGIKNVGGKHKKHSHRNKDNRKLPTRQNRTRFRGRRPWRFFILVCSEELRGEAASIPDRGEDMGGDVVVEPNLRRGFKYNVKWRWKKGIQGYTSHRLATVSRAMSNLPAPEMNRPDAFRSICLPKYCIIRAKVCCRQAVLRSRRNGVLAARTNEARLKRENRLAHPLHH
ncbi:hypothetical protein C8R43DRAFT_1102561 [Mycena crocata]|nr:hypothetical protein C8R43DRAFT_1102561 [Mycena crocata]